MKQHYILKVCLIVLIFKAISLSLIAQTEWETHSDVTIPIPPPEHPRLFLKATDIDDLKRRVTHPVTKPYWDQLKKDANSNIQIRIEVNAAEYLMTGDQQIGYQTLALALQTLQQFTWDPDKLDVSREIGRMMVTSAVAYDWCYPLLTSEQKEAFQTELIRLASALECGYPPVKMGWLTGHKSEWMVLRDMLSAGVAIYNENPEMYLHATLDIFKYAIPARNFWYSGHAFHQGTSYSEIRFNSDLFPLWIYDRMGAGNVFSPEQQYVPYQWIYLRRPDLKIMAGGDGGSRAPRLRSILSAGYYKDGYILGDYLLTPGSSSMDRFFYFLFSDPDLEPLSASDLPLTRYMGFPYGWMVARSGWDANTVMAEMKINVYNFNNHQHLDAGTFQIYHRGPLAIESGSYAGSYGSSHWKNYYTRTIAHNSLLIYVPGEQFKSSGDYTNDGGQRLPNNNSEPKDLSGLLDPANGYKTGEIMAQGIGPTTQTPAYSYLKGDITQAYSAKVSAVKRSFVFLNLFDDHIPAALVVFDKVVSRSPSYKKYWLLHSMEQPAINGNNTIITLNQRGWTGKMINTTLLPEPENLEITPVGGPGKEFWVFGKNFDNPSINPNDQNSESGEWRVEVSPVTPSGEDYFLNVMQMMDKTYSQELDVQRIDGEKVVGVQVADRFVFFSKSLEPIDETFSISITDESTYKVLLTDITPGTWQVKKDEELFLPAQVVKEEDGVIWFEGTKGSYTFEFLSTSLNERSLGKSIFRVYPNPVKEMLKVTFPEGSGRVKIDIYSIEGRKVYSKNLDIHSTQVKQIDITKWPKGIYFIEIQSNIGFQKAQFIVN